MGMVSNCRHCPEVEQHGAMGYSSTFSPSLCRQTVWHSGGVNTQPSPGAQHNIGCSAVFDHVEGAFRRRVALNPKSTVTFPFGLAEQRNPLRERVATRTRRLGTTSAT
jgi:hypothetical protein